MQTFALGKTSLTEPARGSGRTVGEVEPEALARGRRHTPVIAYTRAPVRIIKPPFRSDPLGTDPSGQLEILTQLFNNLHS